MFVLIWIKMEITIKDDFIKLGQALKLAGLVDSGVDASLLSRMVRLKSTEKLTQDVEKNFMPEIHLSLKEQW